MVCDPQDAENCHGGITYWSNGSVAKDSRLVNYRKSRIGIQPFEAIYVRVVALVKELNRFY